MIRLVKKLKNGRKVVFDNGKFDAWCVYVVETNGIRKAPHDVEYFTALQNLNRKYKENKIYSDFCKIYRQTDSWVSSGVLNAIEEITMSYDPADRCVVEQWMTVIYAGMIAEENKENSILKKRIKHLGMYQVLIQNYSPGDAAEFSKGKKWKDLDRVMKSLGI